jgi:hypothetical protein
VPELVCPQELADEEHEVPLLDEQVGMRVKLSVEAEQPDCVTVHTSVCGVTKRKSATGLFM